MSGINHTWFNKSAHVFRTDGRVVRAIMKELFMEGDAIYIKTDFFDPRHGTGIQTKDLSPITIAALQVMWVNVDVVSDMEFPEDMDSVTNFVPPRECDRLPPLDVYTNKTPALKSLLIQVNHFIDISTPVLPPPPIERTPFKSRPRRRRVTIHRTRKDTDGACGGP
jgi:hypothetical protein